MTTLIGQGKEGVTEEGRLEFYQMQKEAEEQCIEKGVEAWAGLKCLGRSERFSMTDV